MNKPNGAARLLDSALLFLGCSAYVLVVDLLVRFVFLRLLGVSGGALSVPAMLAVGAAATAGCATVMALTGRWSRWSRARLGSFQLYVLLAVAAPFLLGRPTGTLAGLTRAPAVMAIYGVAVLLAGAWVMAPATQEKPRAAFLFAAFFALSFGHHALTWLGERGYPLVALPASVFVLGLVWLLLWRLPLHLERPADKARAPRAIALAAIIAACWLLRPGVDLDVGAREEAPALRYLAGLNLATAGNVSRPMHGMLTHKQPVAGGGLEVRDSESLCEVSLFGYAPDGEHARVSCMVYLHRREGEPEQVAQADLVLPMSGWRSLVFDVSNWAGEECVLSVGSVASPDAKYTIAFSGASYSRRLPDEYNVLLISLDGVRADHLGCYGYDRATSAWIDSVAAEGVRFARCNAQSPWSFPSLFSMMIGEFPSVMWADQPLSDPSRRFCDEAPMLARVLRAGGYHTAAITDGGPAVPEGGLYQGFDTYRVAEAPDVESTYRHASRWLQDHAEEKFFLFVQTYGALPPYRKGLFAPAGPGLRERAVAAYDASIAHADMMVGMLLRDLERLGIKDRTLLVITSAHGQDLRLLREGPEGPAGTFGHALSQSVLHVPLIVRAPGLVPSGKVIAQRVALMDVAPTVLALLGMEPLTGPSGFNLTPFFEGKHYPDYRVVFSEATCWGPEQKAVVKERYKLVLTPTPWDKMSEGERRFRSAAGADPEAVAREFRGEQMRLYDLESDPLEQHNIAASRPAVVREYLELLRSVLTRNAALRARHKGQVVGMEEEIIEQGGQPAIME